MTDASNVTPLPVVQTAQVVSESAAVLSMIERASRDPAVDLDKLERLMALRERMDTQSSERAFGLAMKSAQAQMGPIGADATNPQTKSKYATYAKLDSVLRPIYTAHGFSLSFDEGDSPKPDHIRVLCYVTHEGGYTRTYRKDMPADGKGAKGGDVMTKTHATGAAASYGARYLLKGIFNIAIGDEDKDGNRPKEKPPETISEAQFVELSVLIRETNSDIAKFLELGGLENLGDMKAADFAGAKNMLLKKKAKQTEKGTA